MHGRRDSSHMLLQEPLVQFPAIRPDGVGAHSRCLVMFRWVRRIVILVLLITDIPRLDLRLVVTHPDGSAGIAFPVALSNVCTAHDPARGSPHRNLYPGPAHRICDCQHKRCRVSSMRRDLLSVLRWAICCGKRGLICEMNT